MNLYVPEIGDQIKLTSDWKFILYAESRNEALGIYFGYYYNYSFGWLKEEELPLMRDRDYKINYPSDANTNIKNFFSHNDYDARQKANKEAEDNCPEYVKYIQDLKDWNQKASIIGKKEIEVVIPEGTVLAIDRIYIRKGISEYSSITFYAKGMGSVKVIQRSYSYSKKKTTTKKSLRFWAKLNDCNNINFEKIDV